MRQPLLFLFLSIFLGTSAFAQSEHRDQAVYKQYPESYYWSKIMPSIQGDKVDKPERKPSFKVDITGRTFPNDPEKYNQVWHTNPVSQGNTNTCWCYSTTSFYESEVKRLKGKEVRMSEMYTVYWEYIERAKYFVANKGDMYFGEGSETNAVGRMMEKYGMVPYEAYPGTRDGEEFPTHEEMFDELYAYMGYAYQNKLWDEEKVVAGVQKILESHIGPVPTEVVVNGKKMSPEKYLKKELGLEMGDYVHFMSLMESAYWGRAEYKVPDNWWHSDNYYNIPLDDYMEGMKQSLRAGYSFAIGGDVSEAGLVTYEGIAIVPTFDIPSEYIDENARQFRFNNESTTDDHAMHVVGYQEYEGDTWFLVKDSGSGSRHCGEGQNRFGYYFFHEDFVKLKMMNFTVHKDAVKDILEKVNES